MEREQIELITEKILKSPKYKTFYKPTIEKVVQELSFKYKPKELEAMTRKKLHQMWGAYLERPNYSKALLRFNELSDLDTKQRYSPLLFLQSSTQERGPFLEQFYEKIFAIAGNPKSVVEYGCGINALTVPWMDGVESYKGFDLDQEMIDFINQVYAKSDYSEVAEVKVGDILIDKPIEADLTLMLKLAPLLERQDPGSTARIINSLPSKYVAISYPTKSLSGKEKGMEKNYREFFVTVATEQKWKFEELLFENEVVFLVNKTTEYGGL